MDARGIVGRGNPIWASVFPWLWGAGTPGQLAKRVRTREQAAADFGVYLSGDQSLRGAPSMEEGSELFGDLFVA
jgi:hypothetical protein